MRIDQILIADPAESAAAIASLRQPSPALVLAFGAVRFFERASVVDELRRRFPLAAIAGCSTAGEIRGSEVRDGACVVTAVTFDRASAMAVATRLRSMADSFSAGARLAAALPVAGLRAVLVLGTGVRINGSALVRGLQSALPPKVTISGGLAADGGAFERTWTMGPLGCGDDQLVAVGLYGDSLRLSYGSFAGWVPFGPARRVTRCADNVLYELDGERALDIYKRYLGEHAARLPASGLLFPFEMVGELGGRRGIFRTILGVDEAQGSLTLAGDIDPNGTLKLMHSNTERLIDGAETAARAAFEAMGTPPATSLALLVSCVGRKLVMGDRVDEEVEAVGELFGAGATVTGFYSNGEIAGAGFNGECHLHNQTMTITWVAEHAA
jgi:hypothetical protein